MKKILILIPFLFSLLTAEEPEKAPTPAEKLIDLIKLEETIVETGAANFGMVAESLADADLTEAEMAEVKDAFMVYMRELASDPELKAKTTALYEKNFTQEELKALVEFYQTPLGQKTLSTLPNILAETTAFSEVVAQRHVGTFEKALGDILQRKEKQKEDK